MIKNVIIIGAKKRSCQDLAGLVKRVPRFQLTSIIETKEFDAIEKNLECDLAIIDVDQPTTRNFKQFAKFLSQPNAPQIIITSTSKKHAIDAFEAGITDYLLKPLIFERFQQALNRFLSLSVCDEPQQMFTLKANDGNYVVRLNEIIYLQSEKRKTLVYTNKGTYETTRSLKQYQELLPSKQFIRIHKQYIVNVHYISRVQYYLSGRYDIYLNDYEKSIIPVGVKYVSSFKGEIALY